MAERLPVEDEFKILSRCSKEKIYIRINSTSNAEAGDGGSNSDTRASCININRSLTNESTDVVTQALDMIMDRSGDFHDLSNEVFPNKPPICRAVELGQFSAVRSLLDAGFDISAKDMDGSSPLHLAVYLKLYDIMQLLLCRNGPLDSCNVVGYTPLHMAVMNRDVHATHLILNTKQTPVLSYISQGVSCPPIDLRALFSGDTCLHIATEQNCLEMVKLLVHSGANMNALNFHSQSPLILACRYDYPDIVSLLCSNGADSDLRSIFGNERITPIGLCARLNKLEVTRILVEHGADLNAHDDSGPSPLFTALNHQSKEVTDYIFTECLDKGLNVKVSRQNRETLLHALLLYKGDNQCKYARDLVSRGCPVNQATRAKQCPLHEAICWRNTKMVTTLLELGADWDILDRWGQNALHVAVATGEEEVVKILLYHGADINSVTTLGVSPLFIAFEFDYIDIAEYLIHHGSNLRQELYLLKSEMARPMFIAMESKLTPRYLHNNPEYKENLKRLANSPPNLFSICVTCVRQIFFSRRESLSKSRLLPLPCMLQQRISFGM